MSIKTYVLLDSMNADAPIFQRLPNNQREQITRIPRHRPYLQVTFQDENGKSKTIRYKANCDSVDQAVQIKEFGILANEKFTQNERDNPWFKYGLLTTDKQNLQLFLESHPEFNEFKGSCDSVKKHCYKLLDKVGESKIKNDDTKKRVKAAYKIINLELDSARNLLIKINGSYFETPKTGNDESDLQECQNMLTEFLDSTNEAGLDAILKEDITDTIDEKTTVLLGKLINAGELSFDAVADAIAKKGKDNNWIKLRDISATQYTAAERMRLFSDFLNTEDGKPLKNDLEKQMADIERKSAKR
jgi:hypothetical protein